MGPLDMRGPRPLLYSVDTLGVRGALAIKTAHSVKTQHDVKSLFAHVQPLGLYRQYTTYAWCHPPWPRRVEIIVMRGPRPLPYSVDTLGMGVAAILPLHMHGAHSVKKQHDVNRCSPMCSSPPYPVSTPHMHEATRLGHVVWR